MAKKEKETKFEKLGLYLLIAVAVLIVFNQYQLSNVSAGVVALTSSGGGSVNLKFGGSSDLSSVDVTQITTTAQGIALLFPIDNIQTTDDAIAVMIPTGTPEYGEAMGVSYDDPLNSMEAMVKAYRALKQQVQQDPAAWQRYLSLAAAPRGISCEFCCGVGAQGVSSDGNLRCGCKHNPAVQTITLWLIQNTDYSDAEILREVYKWKSLFFPKSMVGLASQIAGGDASVLKDLPGMVGGC